MVKGSNEALSARQRTAIPPPSPGRKSGRLAHENKTATYATQPAKARQDLSLRPATPRFAAPRIGATPLPGWPAPPRCPPRYRAAPRLPGGPDGSPPLPPRSEEHTSELQSRV